MSKHEAQSNKKRGTKAALAASFAALLLCGATLVGTTFAWFTDTATTGNNKIVAGNLDVELEMWDEANNAWKNISKETNSIFGEETSLTANENNADTLWEPGKTQMAYFRIKNEGNLALKYQVWLNTKDEDEDLYKAMRYQVVRDWNVETAGKLKKGDLNTEDYKQPTLGDANVSLVDSTGTKQDGHLAVKDNGISEHYFALAVHMDENANNDYMSVEGDPKEIAFDLAIHATQDTVEKDSFDNKYDEQATLKREPKAAVVKDTKPSQVVYVAEFSDINTAEPVIPNVHYTFTIPEGDREGVDLNNTEYRDYYVDWLIESDVDIPPEAAYLIGQYDLFSENYIAMKTDTTIPKSTPIHLLPQIGALFENGLDYYSLALLAPEFNCGVVETNQSTLGDSNGTLTVKLVMYPTVEDHKNMTNQIVVAEETYAFTGTAGN